MIYKVYHRTFNPTMETLQGVCAETDKLEQGWKLNKVVVVTPYEWVAVFEFIPKESEVKDEQIKY